MGNQCCGDKVYDVERIVYEEESIDKLVAFAKKSDRKRKGYPSVFAEPLRKIEETEDILLEFKSNERKFKYPTKIDIGSQLENRLDEPYELKYEPEEAFYVG